MASSWPIKVSHKIKSHPGLGQRLGLLVVILQHGLIGHVRPAHGGHIAGHPCLPLGRLPAQSHQAAVESLQLALQAVLLRYIRPAVKVGASRT